MKRQNPHVDPPAMPGVTWHHRLCPGCGSDWWHGSTNDGDFALAVDQMVAILGICQDCREGDGSHRGAPRRPAGGAHRPRRERERAKRRR